MPIIVSLLKQGNKNLFVLVYVDDIIITSNDVVATSNLKQYLHNTSSIKDLGDLRYFLGIEVSRSSKDIFLCQRKYILDILQDTCMTGARISLFQLEQNICLLPTTGELILNSTIYHRLISHLLYLTIAYSDIQFAVNNLSQFMQYPRTCHLDVAYRVLRYIKGKIDTGIFLSSSTTLHIHGYTD